jgi:hypothetical protein
MPVDIFRILLYQVKPQELNATVIYSSMDIVVDTSGHENENAAVR